MEKYFTNGELNNIEATTNIELIIKYLALVFGKDNIKDYRYLLELIYKYSDFVTENIYIKTPQYIALEIFYRNKERYE